MSQSVYATMMFLIYILGTYILYWYCHRIFDYKKRAITSFVICLIAHIILWMLIYVFNLPQINIIATTVLYFIVLLNGFKCDWKLSIFHTLLLLTVMVISEVIVIYIVSFLYDVPTNQFEKDNILFVEETFISKLVYFILLAIVSSFSKKTKLTEGLLSSVFLTILPLMTFFVAVIFLYQSIDYGIDTNMKMFFVAIELLMFLANVIVFSVHERSISNQKKVA